MDEDLAQMTREQLIAEVKKLRAGIRENRDSTGHHLCWYHPELWSLLPEKNTHIPEVPKWPQFMRGCVAYRETLDSSEPDSPGATLPRTKKEFKE